MARQGQSMMLLASGIIMVLSLMSQLTAAEQCGRQAGNQKCPKDQCCSYWGWCGDTPEFCEHGCQSQCSGGGGAPGGSTGQASFYGPPYSPNACYGFDTGLFPANLYIAAAGDGNPNLWDDGRNCGRYFRIQCQGKGCRADRGTITVKIVDRCPNGCSGGRAFDLSKEAFSAIADPDVVVITVSYSVLASNSAHPDIADDHDAVPSMGQQDQLITEVGHIDQ